MIYSSTIDKEINQCDIFEKISFSCEGNNSFFSILLNPQCDLILQDSKSKPKAQYLKFAGIISAENVINNILSNQKITKSQRLGKEYIDEESFKEIYLLIREFLRGSIYPRYFYLPPIPGYFNHSMIDFQFVETKKYFSELFSELSSKKIAQLKSSWRESVLVRFSNYNSRIGVIDYDDDFVDQLLIDFKINLIRSS